VFERENRDAAAACVARRAQGTKVAIEAVVKEGETLGPSGHLSHDGQE
jgi:hypothetical protein